MSLDAPPPSSPPHRGIPSVAAVEVIVAALLIAIGLVVAWDSYRLGSGWGSEGPRAGYFPLRLGLILAACGAIILGQALWKRRQLAGRFIEPEQVRPVLTVLLPTTAYVALTAWQGIYGASALFIAAFMLFVGRFSWWKAVVTALTTSLILLWMFEVVFQTPLPKNAADDWVAARVQTADQAVRNAFRGLFGRPEPR